MVVVTISDTYCTMKLDHYNSDLSILIAGVSVGRVQTHQVLPRPHERGERHQVGPPGQVPGLVLRRHDPQGVEHEQGLLRARPPGTQQGDLHHQVVLHRDPIQ